MPTEGCQPLALKQVAQRQKSDAPKLVLEEVATNLSQARGAEVFRLDEAVLRLADWLWGPWITCSGASCRTMRCPAGRRGSLRRSPYPKSRTEPGRLVRPRPEPRVIPDCAQPLRIRTRQCPCSSSTERTSWPSFSTLAGTLREPASSSRTDKTLPLFMGPRSIFVFT
jgi:hypothetical protein